MAQTQEAIFFEGDQDRQDFIPSGAAVVNGQIVVLPVGAASGAKGRIGICTSPEGIADGGLGALAVTGVFKIKKVVADAITFAVGAPVFWDFVNKKAVTAGGANLFYIGLCASVAAVAGDDNVKTDINVFNTL